MIYSTNLVNSVSETICLEEKKNVVKGNKEKGAKYK
jgi:hypothetical protein